MTKYKTLKAFSCFIMLFSIFNLTHIKAETTSTYSVNVVSDKEKVSRGDEFEIKITVQNTGQKPIKNFEVRAPYYDKISDASVVSVTPEFNKLLATTDYPAGFNSKSWLINNFEAGQSRSYIIKYKASTNPTNENGLFAKYTLPLTWNGPDGGGLGNEVITKDFQIDVYADSKYENTYKVIFPIFEVFDNEVSKIRLNEKFYFEGSKSTDLKNINKTNISAFPDFKLETKEVLIEWTDSVDFSKDGTAEAFKRLDELFVPVWGKVEINSDMLPFLSTKANITFKDASFVSESKVKIGTEIKKVSEALGTFDKPKKTIFIPLEKLVTTSLYPNIETTPETIQTSELTFSLKVKVSNPNSTVSYTVNNKDEKIVYGIDISTGEFNIALTDIPKIEQIEIKSKYKNGEEAKKIILVNYSQQIAVSPTKANAGFADVKDDAIAINPITKSLIIAAAAILVVTAGYIYYLYYSRHKPNKEDLSLESLEIKTSADLKSKAVGLENIQTHKKAESNIDFFEKYKAPETDIDLRRKAQSPSNSVESKDKATDEPDKDGDSFLKSE